MSDVYTVPVQMTWRMQPRAAVIGKALPYIMIPLMFAVVFAPEIIDLPYGDLIIDGPEFIFVVFVLTIFISGVMRHRAWRHVRHADYLVCPFCEYPLHGLASSGRCPECGGAYETPSVRTHWNDVHETAMTREGCLRLNDREMKAYIWISIPLFTLGIVFFSVQPFPRHLTGGLPCAFFFLPFVLMVLPMWIGARMSKQAMLRDNAMRRGKPNADTDADRGGEG